MGATIASVASAVDFSAVSTGVLTIAGTVMAVLVTITGVKYLYHALRGR